MSGPYRVSGDLLGVVLDGDGKAVLYCDRVPEAAFACAALNRAEAGERLAAAAKNIEWDEYGRQCPECGGEEPEHYPDCEFGAALKQWEGVQGD